MAVPFGFSVGDFLAAIELTIRIGKALKESGGATTEYRLLQQDLQSLRQVLEILQDLQPAGLSHIRINAIKGMALTCLGPLTEFANKLDRSYASSLGAGSSARLLKRASKKVQWALLSADEVSKFRALISAKVVTASLLLGTCDSEALSRVRETTEETQVFLRDQAAKNEQHLQNNFLELSVNARQNHEDLLARVVQLREGLSSDVSSIKEEQIKRHQNLAKRMDEQQEAMFLLNARLTETFRNAGSHYNRLIGVCCGIKSANRQILRSARAESLQIKSELRLIAANQHEARSRMPSKFQSLLRQVKMLQTIGENVLNLLIPFSQKVLDYLQQNTAKNIEIFTILLRLEASLPKAIADGGADNIFFEDVLGRTKQLPYAYFHHWEVFESMLRCEFRGLPGEQKVLDGHYFLVNGRPDGLQIDKKTWDWTVFPDTRIKMSVEIARWGASWTTVYCPRCRHLFERHLPMETVLYQCTVCNIAFFTQKVPKKRVLLGLPGLEKDDAFSLTRSKSTALQSYLTGEYKRRSHVTANSTATPGSGGVSDTMSSLEAREIYVFRLVHLKDASFTLPDIFTPQSRSNYKYDLTTYTTEFEDANLEKYLRAVLVDDFFIAHSPTTYVAAYGTLQTKVSCLSNSFSTVTEREAALETLYDAICAIISDHIYGLMTDIKRLMRSVDNGIDSEVPQTMIDNVWPGFKKRAGVIGKHSKRLEKLCFESRTERPSILQHADLEMLSLAEGFGFEALQRLVEESVFHPIGDINGLRTEQELRQLYKSAYRPKFHLR